MATIESPLMDVSGRPLGERALRKREDILEATRSLLERGGLRELRVSDIAREVGTSPATFYQYFSDVEDAVLHLAAAINTELAPLLALFDGQWRGAEGRRRALQVVEFFMDYWDRHGALLRVRNLAPWRSQ